MKSGLIKNYDIIFMIISYSTIISVNLIYLHCKLKSSKFNYSSITALLMHKTSLGVITETKKYMGWGDHLFCFLELEKIPRK